MEHRLMNLGLYRSLKNISWDPSIYLYTLGEVFLIGPKRRVQEYNRPSSYRRMTWSQDCGTVRRLGSLEAGWRGAGRTLY
jgi:hypothetical protein